MSTSRSFSFKSKLSKIDGSLIKKTHTHTKKTTKGQGYFTDNCNSKHNTTGCLRAQALLSELDFKSWLCTLITMCLWAFPGLSFQSRPQFPNM